MEKIKEKILLQLPLTEREKGATMEIKKCPFCGGEVKVDTIGYHSGCFRLAGIYCKKCRIFFTCCETEWQVGEDDILEEEKNALLKAWNRRVDDGRED